MNEVSEFFNEATQEIAKAAMRETLRQAMNLTQDVYRKASEVEPPMRPALVNVERPEPPDTLEVLTENLAQLTIDNWLLEHIQHLSDNGARAAQAAGQALHAGSSADVPSAKRDADAERAGKG